MKNLSSFINYKNLFGVLFMVLAFIAFGQEQQQETFQEPSGTFEVPCGVTSITVHAWGGGGGGGKAVSGSGSNNAGGGGAAYASTTIAVTPGDVFSYSVGAGGSGGDSGKDGGDTTFSDITGTQTYVLAKGGKGAVNQSGSGYGAGGNADESTGTVKRSGGNGGTAPSGNSYGSAGGGGAGGPSGNGGVGGNGSRTGFIIYIPVAGNGGTSNGEGGEGGSGTVVGEGGSGDEYGGGGGGAKNYFGVIEFDGGDGGDGVIIVTYTVAEGYEPTISEIQNINSTAGATFACEVDQTTLTAVGGNTGDGVSTLWFKGNTCVSLAFIEEWQNPFTYTLTNTSNSYVGNGVRRFFSGNGARIHMEDVLSGSSTFDPLIHKYISIRYKAGPGSASQTDIFVAKNGVVDEAKKVSQPLIRDSQWHIMNIDLSEHPDWNGSGITGWRYAFSTAGNASVEVDYLVLSSTPLIETTQNHPSADHILNYTLLPTEESVRIGAMRIAEQVAGCDNERESTSCTYLNLNRTTKTYQGSGEWSDASKWLPNGLPESHHCVVIPSGSEVSVDIPNANAGRIRVASGANLTIESNSALSIVNEVVNQAGPSNFIVQNDASLVQLNNVANIGSITVNRHSTPMVRQDATFWSSPVEGQNLKNFSPSTLVKRFYLYNGLTEDGILSNYKGVFQHDPAYPMPNPIPTNWYLPGETSGNLFNPATYKFKKGWGYTIRVANNWTSNEPGNIYEGVFVGIPNNGDVEVPAYGQVTLVGNPYPSAIETSGANGFFSKNPTVQEIQLWTHAFPVGHPSYDNGYITITNLGSGGIGIGSHPDGGTPSNGRIEVGQGFLVIDETKADREEWEVSFDNQMRINTRGVFMRSNNNLVNGQRDQKHRFWLSVKNSADEKLAQILLGYMTGATNGHDHQIDGKKMGTAPLFSLIDGEEYTVQGRAWPFVRQDRIPLGFRSPEAGQYTIKLDAMDGLFAEGQDIYIKDKFLYTVHRLTATDYTFQSEEGEFLNRFEIVFVPQGLTDSVDTWTKNKINVQKINNEIVVSSSIDKILSVELFNLNGRPVYQNNKVNAKELKIQTITLGKQILVVTGQTETGEIFTKKVIIK